MRSSIMDLSTSEQALFDEISTILEKYKGKTREFGVHLVHSHFHLKKNEVLHETHDKIKRTLSVTPKNKKAIPKTSYATSWSFTKTGKPSVEMFCCDNGGGGDGSGGGK